jgi:membrane protease YdiL (CAAX protease family)
MFYCSCFAVDSINQYAFYGLNTNSYQIIRDSIIGIPVLFVFLFGNAIYEEVFLLGYFLRHFYHIEVTPVQ